MSNQRILAILNDHGTDGGILPSGRIWVVLYWTLKGTPGAEIEVIDRSDIWDWLGY